MEDNNLDFDLEGDAKVVAAPDSPALRSVALLVEEWDKARNLKARAEAAIAQANLTIADIEKDRLPAAMAEAGLTEFKTATGRSIKIETVTNGNIPAVSTIEKAKGALKAELQKRRDAAYAYVRKHWPGLVKTELSLAFGRGEAEQALRIAALLREEYQLTPEIAETIHPATLNSHFKELKEDGKLTEVPADLFALYIGPIAKIK